MMFQTNQPINQSTNQHSHVSQNTASINTLDVEDVAVVQSPDNTPLTIAASNSEVSDFPSNVTESSEVESLTTDVQR